MRNVFRFWRSKVCILLISSHWQSLSPFSNSLRESLLYWAILQSARLLHSFTHSSWVTPAKVTIDERPPLWSGKQHAERWWNCLLTTGTTVSYVSTRKGGLKWHWPSCLTIQSWKWRCALLTRSSYSQREVVPEIPRHSQKTQKHVCDNQTSSWKSQAKSLERKVGLELKTDACRTTTSAVIPVDSKCIWPDVLLPCVLPDNTPRAFIARSNMTAASASEPKALRELLRVEHLMHQLQRPGLT